jgi:hypothetical protein
MNQRLLALFALGSASLCAVVFTACGGDDTNTNDSGGGDATTNDVANDTVQNNDTGGNDTGGNDGGGNDSAIDTGCAPGPGCNACCITNYPDAAAFFVATETTCACTTPGDCNTNQTCKNNLCNGQNANGACTTCLNDKDAGDCRKAAGAACVQSASCQPFAQCFGQCAAVVTDAGGGG